MKTKTQLMQNVILSTYEKIAELETLQVTFRKMIQTYEVETKDTVFKTRLCELLEEKIAMQTVLCQTHARGEISDETFLQMAKEYEEKTGDLEFISNLKSA